MDRSNVSTIIGHIPTLMLGSVVKDRVSGLVGTATSRTEYMNGCVQYAVQTKHIKGATEIPSWNIDEAQLELVEKKKVKKKRTGGPMTKVRR